MKKIAGVLVAVALLLIALSGWFFTLLVDIPMLLVLGYAVTFFIYRVPARKWKFIGVYAAFLFPINILMLWVGGVLPYLNLMTPEAVYFYVLPAKWLGISGNDFMWNGLTLPIIGRILPLESVPTYRHFLFNAYALLLWFCYPLALGLASLRAYAHSLVNAPWYRIFFPELLKRILLAVVIFVVTSGIALGIARIYV